MQIFPAVDLRVLMDLTCFAARTRLEKVFVIELAERRSRFNSFLYECLFYGLFKVRQQVIGCIRPLLRATYEVILLPK